ncbi:hypothetical protein OESDEN_21154 [Oesophagostomum dentatum]|uniref:Uncharacterized protein n=1 Tax=Oesophagostomum dentatum TaxID=61180 RepID=A0A0B1S5Q6_OESDE|nr:hypothetical protein OESDEN_21154 [Oesophagostomum dentatum]
MLANLLQVQPRLLLASSTSNLEMSVVPPSTPIYPQGMQYCGEYSGSESSFESPNNCYTYQQFMH